MLDNLFSNIDGDDLIFNNENLIEYKDDFSNVFIISYSFQKNAIKIIYNYFKIITINYGKHFAYIENLIDNTCENIWEKSSENFSLNSIIFNYKLYSYMIKPNNIENFFEYILDETIVNILKKIINKLKINIFTYKTKLNLDKNKDINNYQERSREYADNKIQQKSEYVKLINKSDDNKNKKIIIKFDLLILELTATYKEYNKEEKYSPFNKIICSLN